MPTQQKSKKAKPLKQPQNRGRKRVPFAVQLMRFLAYMFLSTFINIVDPYANDPDVDTMPIPLVFLAAVLTVVIVGFVVLVGAVLLGVILHH